MRKYFLASVASIVLLALVGALLSSLYRNYMQEQQNHQTKNPIVSNTCGKFPSKNSSGIGVSEVLADKEPIGLSDGTFAFDLNRSQGYIGSKCTGAQDFLTCVQLQKPLACSDAETSLTSEVGHLSDDAEALIYRQNVRIWEQSSFYFTVIVGISLSNANIISSRYLLQGVYVAQEEYNRTHKHFKLRVLIANFGDTATSSVQVIQQIMTASKADPTIVGIVNLPFIASTDSALVSSIQKLVSLTIPVIFPTGSIGSSNEQYSTIFHIAPAAWQEGNDGALYVQKTLNMDRVTVFVDSNDGYSRNLACSFLEQFVYHNQLLHACDLQFLTSICAIIGICRYYQQDNISAADASAALNSTPQVIYFAGDVSGAKSLLAQLNLLPQFKQLPDLRIIGGNALYQPGAYVTTDYPHMAFSAFAYADEWLALDGLKPTVSQLLQAPFFDEYALDFRGWPPEYIYGFIRPDSDAILSYDATNTLLQSIEQASNDGAIPNVSLNKILQAVQNVSWQGFSGYIHFDTQGNPIQKTTVFLVVNETGEAQMEGVHGCFRSLSTYCFYFPNEKR